MKCKQCGKVLDRKYFTPICQDCYNLPEGKDSKKSETTGNELVEKKVPSESEKKWTTVLKYMTIFIFAGKLIMFYNGWETIPSWIGHLPEYLFIGSLLALMLFGVVFALIQKILHLKPKKIHKAHPVVLYSIFTVMFLSPLLLTIGIVVNRIDSNFDGNRSAIITQYYPPGRSSAGYGMNIINPDGTIDEVYVDATSVCPYKLKRGDKGRLSIRRGLLGICYVESYKF